MPERTLSFDGGTLVLEHFPWDEVPAGFVVDDRIKLPRGMAFRYRELFADLTRRQVPFRDEARRYGALGRPMVEVNEPRPYQREAVDAWVRAGRRGVVVLPTGAGKSLVARLCIANADRDTLVVAPTLDLVGQWYDTLRRAFPGPVGIVGGGHHDVQALTVTTYDSAYLHVERYGNRFGLVVYDEVHHLPGPQYGFAAEGSLAPFRLGLTATPERPDGGHDRYGDLVGPLVYRREITELSGDYLANYRTEVLRVELSEEEALAYREARETYRSFVESSGISTGSAGGWQQFIRASARSPEGRAAMAAWRESRRLVQGNQAKKQLLAELLAEHRDRRVLIFTSDNATVYEISRSFLVPAITHRTSVKERRALMEAFTDGSLPVLATSRVLNEGVDLPLADVAIVLSGSGTVREHVQRLGRILRWREGKEAVLYEVVAADTVEEGTSERRRGHVAYGAPRAP